MSFVVVAGPGATTVVLGVATAVVVGVILTVVPEVASPSPEAAKRTCVEETTRSAERESIFRIGEKKVREI